MKTTLRLITTGLLLLGTLTAGAFFDPTIGRWASRDPVREGGGQNVYAFIHNVPNSAVDLLGLSCFCALKEPLTVRLATPREIYPGGGSFMGPRDKAVWDGKFAMIWFIMRAKFANSSGRCCEFRQNVRGGATVDDIPYMPNPDIKGHFTDDGYNRSSDPRDYQDDDSNEDTTFSSWDNPGWPGPPPGLFSGWMEFEGYIVDVCKNDRLVGTKLTYGFKATGTPPAIKIDLTGIFATARAKQ